MAELTARGLQALLGVHSAGRLAHVILRRLGLRTGALPGEGGEQQAQAARKQGVAAEGKAAGGCAEGHGACNGADRAAEDAAADTGGPTTGAKRPRWQAGRRRGQ